MLQKMTRINEKGFTLIELMIVIAIIGILAAIAIPNFIAYRNKAFCSSAESDALSIAGAIANYFSNPTYTTLVTLSGAPVAAAPLSLTLSNGPNALNTGAIAGVDPNLTITITVTDTSGRCPADYKANNPAWVGDIYTKFIRQ